jgi:hypothetical protein
LARRGDIRIVLDWYQLVDEIAELWREKRQSAKARVQSWGRVLGSFD